MQIGFHVMCETQHAAMDFRVKKPFDNRVLCFFLMHSAPLRKLSELLKERLLSAEPDPLRRILKISSVRNNKDRILELIDNDNWDE